MDWNRQLDALRGFVRRHRAPGVGLLASFVQGGRSGCGQPLPEQITLAWSAHLPLMMQGFVRVYYCLGTDKQKEIAKEVGNDLWQAGGLTAMQGLLGLLQHWIRSSPPADRSCCLSCIATAHWWGPLSCFPSCATCMQV